MYHKMICKALIAAFIAIAVTTVHAKSDATFPKEWQSWPVTHSGAIPGNKKKISSSLPPIVQATFKTYNWIQDGKGSPYNVRVNPKQRDAQRTGKSYNDGPSAVLELTAIKVLLVTEHLLGQPQYGVYTYDGKDITTAHPSLNPKTCNTCHTGYKEACRDGICSK